MDIAIGIVFWTVVAVTGAVIGARKNRAALGFWLGAALGFAGLAIIALLPPRPARR